MKLDSSEAVARAKQMFKAILMYTDPQDLGKAGDRKVAIVEGLLHEVLTRPELRDELYLQLIKQTGGNPSAVGQQKVWELLSILSYTVAPSKVKQPHAQHCTHSVLKL